MSQIDTRRDDELAVETLSVIEAAELTQCEAVIERGLHTFVEVGDALMDIRDKRLYRAGYRTFEDYCRDRWGWERRHAYRLMDAAKAVENVSHGTQIAPTSERQARPLTALPPDVQPIVWQQAVDTAPNGRITAAHVQNTVNEMTRREVRILERQVERDTAIARLTEEYPEVDSRYTLHCAAVNEASRYIMADSLDWIITDPPYPKEYLGVYGELAGFARYALRPGGSLLVMCGQSYLPEIVALLVDQLEYHWTLAYLTPGGQATQLWQRNVNTFWKPLLWFTKGQYVGQWIGDVCRSKTNDNDKEHHIWEQSESGMADIVERMTKPGEIICDPFCGSGTTGVVALTLSRLFVGLDIDADCIRITRQRLEKCQM